MYVHMVMYECGCTYDTVHLCWSDDELRAGLPFHHVWDRVFGSLSLQTFRDLSLPPIFLWECWDQTRSTMPGFMCSGNLNSGPHTFKVNVLPTKPCLQPRSSGFDRTDLSLSALE